MNNLLRKKLRKLNQSIYQNSIPNEKILETLFIFLPFEEDHETIVTNAIAKSYYKMGKYQHAIHFYKEGILKNFENKASYIGLFKCYLCLNEIEESLKYLNLYEDISKKENKSIDINLFSSMLIYKNQNEFIPVPISNFYLTEKIKDEEVQQLYQQLILFYNVQSFSDCLEIAMKLNDLKKEKHLPFDFEILLHLITELQKIRIK